MLGAAAPGPRGPTQPAPRTREAEDSLSPRLRNPIRVPSWHSRLGKLLHRDTECGDLPRLVRPRDRVAPDQGWPDADLGPGAMDPWPLTDFVQG